MATLLVRCQSLRDKQKRFFAYSVSCVKAKRPRLAWMDSSNAKMERYAYFSVFSHNWLPFLLWHVEIVAVIQNPTIKHLNYNVSAIHPWYWLLLSFQISHRAKTYTPRTIQPCSDLSHARMWTSGDLTRWMSDFAGKSSALKFWITHQRGNLYVPTSSALTSSPLVQSHPFGSPTSANKTGLRIYRSRTKRVIRLHISVRILLTAKSAVKPPVLTCHTCIGALAQQAWEAIQVWVNIEGDR